MLGVRISLHIVSIVFLVLVHRNVFTEDSTFECSKCKELVETGIIYEGYGSGIGVISNVDSWSECKKCCTEELKCNFWTHYSSQHNQSATLKHRIKIARMELRLHQELEDVKLKSYQRQPTSLKTICADSKHPD